MTKLKTLRYLRGKITVKIHGDINEPVLPGYDVGLNRDSMLTTFEIICINPSRRRKKRASSGRTEFLKSIF